MNIRNRKSQFREIEEEKIEIKTKDFNDKSIRRRTSTRDSALAWLSWHHLVFAFIQRIVCSI